MKNNISYYPRRTDSYRHPKLKLLKVKYGREGKDRFWDLCDMIGEAEHCFLGVSELFDKASIAETLEMSLDALEEFLLFLEYQCKLIYSEDGMITTVTAQKTLSEVMKSRAGAKERYENRKNTTSDEKPKTSDEKKQINKVSTPRKHTNKREVNKIKVKGSKAHLFTQSPFYDFELFEKEFSGTDYEFCNLKIYYEKVKNWSAGGAKTKIDWIATVRNWMIGDQSEGKLILKNGVTNGQKTGNNQKGQGNFGAEIDQLINDRYGNGPS